VSHCLPGRKPCCLAVQGLSDDPEGCRYTCNIPLRKGFSREILTDLYRWCRVHGLTAEAANEQPGLRQQCRPLID
jgi:hypothetical protein